MLENSFVLESTSILKTILVGISASLVMVVCSVGQLLLEHWKYLLRLEVTRPAFFQYFQQFRR